MKKCSVCKTQKPSSAFNKRSDLKDGLQKLCRECSKKHWQKYYSDPKRAKRHKKRAFIRNTRVRKQNKEKIKKYLKSHPCVDCGESDLIVLDFDHVKGKKSGNVSEMVNSAFSWDRIIREIKKCKIRCANCHRRVTHKRAYSSNGRAIALQAKG